MKYYTVFNNQTDDVVVFGSSQTCADALQMSVDSFYCLVSRGGSRKYSVVAEPNETDKE